MQILLLSIGSAPAMEACTATAAALRESGATDVEALPVAPTAAAVDEALSGCGGRRLVVEAGLADLALALNRLMRRGELGAQEVAVLPTGFVPYLGAIGVPASRSGQLRSAVGGTPRLVGVIKDDSGGVCVDHASVLPWGSAAAGPAARVGARWWVRAVVDDQRLCDGSARGISVRRIGPSELEATVQLGRWRRRTVRGRSLQLACDDALISQDGIDRERPRSKRTFWSEPELFNLCV